MNIKAKIPAGVTALTVHGLHQWDYGRKLEIHDAELPAIIEVHFACAGMKEAVVRVCDVNAGVAIAAIPDSCLEQTNPVTAWVYIIDGTTGTTTKAINLPIIARTRPAATESVPEEYTDKYTQAITAMNALLSGGTVSVGYASKAGHAETAGSAANAETAGSAANADQATMLTPAETVVTLKEGRALLELDSGGLYTIAFDRGDNSYTFMLKVGTKPSYSALSGCDGLYLMHQPSSGAIFVCDDAGAIGDTVTAYINRIF